MFEQKYPEIKIVEVGPRDGLQNEKKAIATEDKISFINALAEAGLQNIEATSFVKPQAVAQMSDSSEVFEQVFSPLSQKGKVISALIPNMKGFEQALALGIKDIALFTATSELFNKKNINATIDESFERQKLVAQEAKKRGINIRVYISTAFGCPYEGEIPVSQVLNIYKRALEELSADEVAVSDTIGSATPKHVQTVIKAVKKDFGLKKCALHFHDTRGMALCNILTALENEIYIFDSAAGGLGGCPYAKGATGNVATEDLVYLLESLGVSTGIDMDKLSQASSFIFEKIEKSSTSKFLTSYLKAKQSV